MLRSDGKNICSIDMTLQILLGVVISAPLNFISSSRKCLVELLLTDVTFILSIPRKEITYENTRIIITLDELRLIGLSTSCQFLV